MNPLKVEVPRLWLFVLGWDFPQEAELPASLSCSSTRLPIVLFEKRLLERLGWLRPCRIL